MDIKFGYYIDLVLCIDATGGMKPILDEVKRTALSLYPRIKEDMAENEVDLAKLRVKVIVFRDYAYDEEPMVQSEFFTLPEQEEDLKRCVDAIEAHGGGDISENALEAIAYALKSDWTTEGIKRRHVIAVFTDAPALPLGERSVSALYPSDLPKDFAELTAMWEGEDRSGVTTFEPSRGRLIAFVPEDESWINLEEWNRYFPMYMGYGRGCAEFDMRTVIDALIDSIGG